MDTVYCGELSTLEMDGDVVAGAITITTAGLGQGAISTTALGDTVKSYRPSKQPEPGTSSVSGLMGTSGASLLAAASDGVEHEFVLTLRDNSSGSSSYNWKGFVTSFAFNGVEEEGNVGFDAEIQNTTLITAGTGSALMKKVEEV